MPPPKAFPCQWTKSSLSVICKTVYMQISRMLGMRVLLIGVMDDRKEYVWDATDQLGVQLCAVGTVPSCRMQDKVAKYIQYDASDHANDKDHCDVIVQRVTSEFGDVDGCITLWDLYVPLTALVCARLGKPGIPHAGAFAAMSKTLTMNTLASVSGEKERGSLSKYTSSCYPVKSISDLENLHGQLNFPAILKVDFGAGSVATKLANSVQEGIDHFRNIQNLQKHSERSYYLGGSFSSTCMLAEYLEGSEHCVDLAIFHGELVCAFVSDKGPQIPPDVFKTVITMPSLLLEDKLESVITAAYECCMGLKLEHGVFDVDVMLTKSGPKLIEINPRVGGYCQREFILQCYKVDLAHLAFMVACDVRPTFASTVAKDTFSVSNGVTKFSASSERSEDDAIPSSRAIGGKGTTLTVDGRCLKPSSTDSFQDDQLDNYLSEKNEKSSLPVNEAPGSLPQLTTKVLDKNGITSFPDRDEQVVYPKLNGSGTSPLTEVFTHEAVMGNGETSALPITNGVEVLYDSAKHLPDGTTNSEPLKVTTAGESVFGNETAILFSRNALSPILPHSCHVVGMYCHPWRHGAALKSTANPLVLQDLHDKGEILFLRHERELLEQPHEISFCTVAVKDESFSVARSKLIQVCRRLGLDCDATPVEDLLGYFHS